ncbi:unnamed protein product [Candida verbasci]|uniref:Sulfhydryl oxidase n=1 Tax=Candida verbasci TaxID=1227364 RepID=A0A9W4U099_9ASCO|nr:unnamed protein product [Candida verbasci]
MIHIKRHTIVPICILISIICCIYYLTTSTSQIEKSLGNSSPINIVKDSKNVLNYFDQKQEKSQQKVQELEEPDIDESVVSDDKFTDTPFMPKMQNETLKAQLGQSSWRLFHTILARYPELPTTQQKNTLESYIYLFGQVYPCGDCARHFQTLLKKYPPQIGSRKTAALWGCHIHNKVNERLNKPEYDCTTILEDYDCGCGNDEESKDETLKGNSIKELKEQNLKFEKEEIQQG